MIGNSFQLVGRLTKDPTLRYGARSQTAYTSLTIAINYGKDENGNERADYPEVVAFGKLAERIEQYSGKGQMIAIEGHLSKSHYKDDTGKDIWKLQAIADQAKFISFKPRSEEKRAAAPEPEAYDDPVAAPGGFDGFTQLNDDDLPF